MTSRSLPLLLLPLLLVPLVLAGIPASHGTGSAHAATAASPWWPEGAGPDDGSGTSRTVRYHLAGRWAVEMGPPGCQPGKPPRNMQVEAADRGGFRVPDGAQAILVLVTWNSRSPTNATAFLSGPDGTCLRSPPGEPGFQGVLMLADPAGATALAHGAWSLRVVPAGVVHPQLSQSVAGRWEASVMVVTG